MSNFPLTLAQLAAIATVVGLSIPNITQASHTPEIRIQEHVNPANHTIQSAESSVEKPLSILHESMWQRLQAEFEFVDLDNERIDKQIDFLKAGTRSLRSNLIDASPYLFHITEQLSKAGIPTDLALLPLIESAFNPMALSHKSAVGIWQFIPSTANHYGLSTGKHYDQRKDVMASTTAAIRYLNDLKGMFDGDWLLALAAYNTGPGNVRAEMRRALRRGREPTYWNLKLSTETANYVPRLIAATRIISDPEKYGLELPALANRKQIESVSVGRRISLSQIAELTNFPLKKIEALNLGLHNGLTPPDGPHTLTLPIEATQPLLDALNKLKRQPLIKKSTVQPIAALSVPTKEFQDAFIIDRQPPAINDVIEAKDYMPFKTYQYKTHTVKPGDNLWKISRQLNVDVETLREWNNLQNGAKSIQAGDQLRVAAIEVENLNPATVKLMNYRVLATDTLPTIADKFDLQIGTIKKWNKSLWQRDHVQAGQTLRIPTNIP